MKNKITTLDMTYIAIGIAAMISGGFLILYLSQFFPIPGVKYILMSPYLSMTIYIILSRVKSNMGILIIGVVFGLIMSIFNIFMGVAITATTIGTFLSTSFLNKRTVKDKMNGILFSCYTGLSALLVSKYLIGGVFEKITVPWILLSGFLCLCAGIIGVGFGMRIVERMKLQ